MEPTQDSAKQNDAPANYENAFMYWHERAMAADQTVERLERELMEANDRADRAVKDRAAVLDVKTKEGMTCSEWLMRTAKAEKEVDDLKQQVAQLREFEVAFMDVFGWEINVDGGGPDSPIYRRKNWETSQQPVVYAYTLKEIPKVEQTAHTTLRGLVEQATKMLTELMIIPVGCSREQELSWKKAVKDLREAATLPREGGAQEVQNEAKI